MLFKEREVRGVDQTDLSLARDRLPNDPGITVVAIKDGRCLGTASGTGLRPLLELTSRLGQGLKGGAVADKVVGLAAAFVLIDAGVTGVYGEMLSKEAKERLETEGIEAEGGKMVPHILRPDGQARCLLEQQVQHMQNAAEAVAKLKDFLATGS